MIKDVKDLLNKDLDTLRELSWQEREQQDFKLYITEKLNCFTARIDIVNEYVNILLSKEISLFLLKGEAGIGKSTILCNVISILINENCNVFPFICGNSSRSNTILDFLLQAVYYLEKLLHKQIPFQLKKQIFMHSV